MKNFLMVLFLIFAFISYGPVFASGYITTKDNIKANQIYKYNKLCSRDECFAKVNNFMTLKEVEKKLGGKLFYIKTAYEPTYDDNKNIYKLYGCRLKDSNDIFFTILFSGGSKYNPEELNVMRTKLEFISNLNGNMYYSW